jgi:uncharacterized protein
LLVPTYKQNLKSLSAWLDKASNSKSNSNNNNDEKVEEEDLLMKRLAPDMFPLATQIRFVCFQAQEVVYRLQGKEIPEHVLEVYHEARKLGAASAPGSDHDDEGGPRPPMNKDTVEAAKARIQEALSFLETLEADALDLDGSAKRMIVLEPGMNLTFDLTGEQFVRDWALPQFYFHIVTAYSILRNAGVDLGKADFVPHMFAYLRPPAPVPTTTNEEEGK